MAKDDYYVIAYRILCYLYQCLKNGVKPDKEYIGPDTSAFDIPYSYWRYIISHLEKDGYIEGVAYVSVLGKNEKDIKLTDRLMITPAGIDYMQNNQAMNKAFNFLKMLKESIPGL